jgi:hypothetical protein
VNNREVGNVCGEVAELMKESLLKIYRKEELLNGIDIDLGKVLGAGGEGIVISYQYQGERHAVKISGIRKSDDGEIINTSQVDHEHIIKLKAWAILANYQTNDYFNGYRKKNICNQWPLRPVAEFWRFSKF